MDKRIIITKQMRDRWLLVAIAFTGGLLATLTGIYFLYVPTGGYQGGRNVYPRESFLLARSTWEDLHIWGGVIMLSAVLVHLVKNWKWVVVMCKRVVNTIHPAGANLSRKTKVNIAVNLVLGISFIGSAISGVHFLFNPRGGFLGSRHINLDVVSQWNERSWDLTHTWSGVMVILAVLLHLIIHWRWILKTTQSVFSA